MKNLFASSFLLIIVSIFVGCGKESVTLDTAPVNDYYPLQVGKTYLYRLDSTITASFGTSLIVKSYQAKDSIESSFNDNQGRLSYRIFRLVRDTAGRQPWKFAATYVATPTATNVEYVDNNLRFLKLTAPVTEGFSWKGHSFLNVDYLYDWDYEYRNVNQPYVGLNKTYDNSVTVFQRDETIPNQPFDPNNYQQRNYGVEVYSKGVGLIFKEFIHWTWNISSSTRGYEDGSYGVKLRLISHN